MYRGMVGFGHANLNGTWDPWWLILMKRGVVRNNVVMKVPKSCLEYQQLSGHGFQYWQC